MKFRIVAAIGIAALLATAGWVGHLRAGKATQGPETLSQNSEIDSLFSNLDWREVSDSGTAVLKGPTPEERKRVRESLVGIAVRGPESRSNLISALIRVLKKEDCQAETINAERWT